MERGALVAPSRGARDQAGREGAALESRRGALLERLDEVVNRDARRSDELAKRPSGELAVVRNRERGNVPGPQQRSCGYPSAG